MQFERIILTVFFLVAAVQTYPQSRPLTYSEAKYGKLIYGLFVPENYDKSKQMFHGSADDVNPPDLTERVYNRLVEIGATKMRYTNYPGYGHEIWNLAESEPSWFDWMFLHSKTDSEPSNAVEY